MPSANSRDYISSPDGALPLTPDTTSTCCMPNITRTQKTGAWQAIYRLHTLTLYAHTPRTRAEKSLQKYVLTLLAQRRELQLSDIQELLTSGGLEDTEESLGQKRMVKGATSAILDAERRGLQDELTLPLDSSYSSASNAADAMWNELMRAKTPLAGGWACFLCVHSARFDLRDTFRRVVACMPRSQSSCSLCVRTMLTDCPTPPPLMLSIVHVCDVCLLWFAHAGSSDALFLLWFCKSRQAALALEQRQLHEHISAVHAGHLLHVMHVAAKDAGITPPRLPEYHLDHVGPLEPNGTCGCAQVGRGEREEIVE